MRSGVLIEDAHLQTAAAVDAGLTALHWQIWNRIRREILENEHAIRYMLCTSGAKSCRYNLRCYPIAGCGTFQPDYHLKRVFIIPRGKDRPEQFSIQLVAIGDGGLLHSGGSPTLQGFPYEVAYNAIFELSRPARAGFAGVDLGAL